MDKPEICVPWCVHVTTAQKTTSDFPACLPWLRKCKLRVSVALICTTDHTCTSAYLLDVVSVLCLPTSRIVIKHNQQECFIADWQHKLLKKAIIGATICCHISLIVPCAFGHHTRGIQINQLDVMHHILMHFEHVGNIKPSVQCFVICIICISIWNKTFCKLTRFVLMNRIAQGYCLISRNLHVPRKQSRIALIQLLRWSVCVHITVERIVSHHL